MKKEEDEDKTLKKKNSFSLQAKITVVAKLVIPITFFCYILYYIWKILR